MRTIVPIVEGEGDQEAVPVLLRSFLYAREIYDVEVSRPLITHSLGRLNKKFTEYLTYASRVPDCFCILIILDLDDGCPVNEVAYLCEKLFKIYFEPSIVIVFSHNAVRLRVVKNVQNLPGIC